MSEVKLSERSQKILSTFAIGEIYIRQQSLAEQLGCSRRTVGRALKELKEAGLLVDLNKRHENYEKTFRIVFKTPDLEQNYRRVAGDLRHEPLG